MRPLSGWLTDARMPSANRARRSASQRDRDMWEDAASGSFKQVWPFARKAECRAMDTFRARPEDSPQSICSGKSLALSPAIQVTCSGADRAMDSEKRPVAASTTTSHQHRDPAGGAAGHSPAPTATAMHLNSLELALLAQFNLEMAAAYDEVAEDHKCGLVTRHTARESASRRRQRARMLESEAQRLAAYPTSVPEQTPYEQPMPYAGPERRKGERRRRERRRPVPSSTRSLGIAERRANRDRRRRERRAQAL